MERDAARYPVARDCARLFFHVIRTSLFTVALALAILAIGLVANVRAATGVLEIDEAAITVKNPSHVYLDSITRAGDRLVAAGEHGVIIYSDDNGATWRQARVPVDVTLTCLAFVTPKLGWAAGNYGVILATADGGQSWSMQLNGTEIGPLTLAAAQQAVASKSRSPGLPAAIRRANIFISQGPDKPFLSILALSDQEVLVFGAYRMAVRSNDGGKSWADWSLHIDNPISQHIYGVARIGSSLYLTGEEGLVFRSDNAGDEFKQVTSPADATLFGVLGSGDGLLAYGVAGTAYKSADCGVHWQAVAFDPSSDLTAAIMLKSDHILVGSEAGKLYISRDDGTSFMQLPGNLPMSVAGLAQAANGAIIAIGSRGVILLGRLPSGSNQPE